MVVPKRFAAPQPYTEGEAIFDVSGQSRVMCPQLDMVTQQLVGQEDCLLLNIYTPNIESGDLAPVMVWIHGGSLITGSNTFPSQGPQHFMDR